LAAQRNRRQIAIIGPACKLAPFMIGHSFAGFGDGEEGE